MIAEPSLARHLLEMFFHAPAANALLVFDENEFQGVILKRDVEMGIAEGHFVIEANINPVRTDELPDLVFKNGRGAPGPGGCHSGVPAVDAGGRLIRILSREEFLCQFFFEDFRPGFDPISVLDTLDHPLVITDVFLKIVYANGKAEELFGGGLTGRNLGTLLGEYHVSSVRESRFLEKDGQLYRMEISQSESANFAYRVHQFVRT